MADELFIGGRVDPGLLTDVDKLRLAIKGIDLNFREGKIGAEQAKGGLKQVDDAYKALNLDLKQHYDIQSKLLQVNSHVDSNFKTLSQSMREMYREERLQNRTLSEMKDIFTNLGGMAGGGVVGGLIGNFRALEFSLNSSSIALAQAGGRWSSLGSIIAGIGTPLAVVGAGFFAIAQYISKTSDEIDRLQDELDKLQGNETWSLWQKKQEAGEPGFMAKLGMMGGWASIFSREPQKWALQSSVAQEKYRQAHMAGWQGMGYTDQEMQAQLEYERAIRGWNIETGEPTGIGYMGRSVGGGSLQEMLSRERAQRQGQYSPYMGTGQLGMSGISEGAQGRVTGQINPLKGIETGAIRARVQFTQLEHFMINSMGQVSDSIEGVLSTAFSNVFGKAQTLLGQLLNAVASTLGSILISLGVRSALSLIPGIGPLLSGGLSAAGGAASGAVIGGGGNFDMGEIGGLSAGARTGGGGMPLPVTFKIAGNDLVGVYDRSRVVTDRLRY